MPILMGKVSFNRCTSNKWLPKIRDELTHQNVPIDKVEGLQKLKGELLVHGESGWAKGKRMTNASGLGN
jgi:hypothetical protein